MSACACTSCGGFRWRWVYVTEVAGSSTTPTAELKAVVPCHRCNPYGHSRPTPPPQPAVWITWRDAGRRLTEHRLGLAPGTLETP